MRYFCGMISCHHFVRIKTHIIFPETHIATSKKTVFFLQDARFPLERYGFPSKVLWITSLMLLFSFEGVNSLYPPKKLRRIAMKSTFWQSRRANCTTKLFCTLKFLNACRGFCQNSRSQNPAMIHSRNLSRNLSKEQHQIISQILNVWSIYLHLLYPLSYSNLAK